MVQLMESGNLLAETEIMSSSGKKVTVKLEIAEDPLEEDHEPLNKRYKPSQAVQQVLILLWYLCLLGWRENEQK